LDSARDIKMTLQDYFCQLCGVSFCVARIRRGDEERTKAWAPYNEPYVHVMDDMDLKTTEGEESEEQDDYQTRRCPESSKCVYPIFTGNWGKIQREHVAGPGCMSRAGYSGYRISVEEMKVK